MRRFLIPLLILLSNAGLGQVAPRTSSDYRNLEKYWFYRYRLVNDFMKIGPNCGESLPFNTRTTFDGNRRDSSLGTGGEIPIHLGDYIAVLATEYRLLQNNGLNTSRTDYELDLAIRAFERMDRYAEAHTHDFANRNYYSQSCTPQNEWPNILNGYFIRDDIPYLTFLENNSVHFNRKGALMHVNDRYVYKGLKSCALDRWEKIKPGVSFFDYWYQPWVTNKCVPHEESKDGTINLAMGFALTRRLLPTSNPSNFRAAENLTRMVKFIQGPSIIGTNWKIINPVTTSCVFGDNATNKPCDGGGNYLESTSGAALAAFLWGSTFDISLLNDASSFKYRTMWQAMQYVTFHRDFNFWGMLAALTSSWQYAPPLGLISIGNSTWPRLTDFAKAKSEGCAYLPYLYRVMFPGKGSHFMSVQTEIKLDEAPPCGPHNYFGDFSNRITDGVWDHNGPYAWHWSGQNLLHSYYDRNGFKGEGDYDKHTDFNGIDYMAFFNLYSLQSDSYLKSMFNSYYCIGFNTPVPCAFPFIGPLGTPSKRLKLNFLEYVSCLSKIQPDGYLTMRCGKTIDLIPGFDAKMGSTFTGYIEDYHIDCGSANEMRPSEEYHYAELNERSLANGLEAQQYVDTTYVLDFAPDGVPYVPDSAALVFEDLSDSDSITCEQKHAHFLSLVDSVYATGDTDLISYWDTAIIPNAYFPCDSVESSLMRKTKDGNEQNQFREGVDVRITPNPTAGIVTILFGDVGNYRIKVSDFLGVNLSDTVIFDRRKQDINLNGLANGIYIIEIQDMNIKYRRYINKVVLSR